MRLDNSMKVRNIAGCNVIIKQDTESEDMTSMISLNNSAMFVWDNIIGKDFSEETIAKLLTDNFMVSDSQAKTDATALVKQLKECGAIVEE